MLTSTRDVPLPSVSMVDFCVLLLLKKDLVMPKSKYISKS